MMQGKRMALKLTLGMVVTITILGGYLAIGVSSQGFTKSACACGTVNMDVVMRLDYLDSLAQQYAAQYGKFPTYAQLLILASGEGVERGLISQVDIVSGAFTFTPTHTDASKIGYAVSADHRRYVLIGIGLTEKHRTTFFYGHEVWTRLIGFELPILHPGDTPPAPSPIQ